jgi:hypothetical protein
MTVHTLFDALPKENKIELIEENGAVLVRQALI